MLKQISIFAAILVIAFSLNSVILAQQEGQKQVKTPKTEVKKEVSKVPAQSKVTTEEKVKATKKAEVKKTETGATQKKEMKEEEMKGTEKEKAPEVKKMKSPKVKSETKESSTNPKK